MSYDVIARRWSQGWELHIEGLGVTQSRSLGDAPQQCADYVESLTGVGEPADAFRLRVELGQLGAEISKARRDMVTAQAAEREAAANSRRVALRLRAMGFSVADTAYVLGISRGRVSQMAGKRVSSTAKTTPARRSRSKARATAASE